MSMTALRRHPATALAAEREADVCLIVEGAYPYVSGGLSSWLDGLIRRHADLRFDVVTILPQSPPPPSKYAIPQNVGSLHHLYLDAFHGRRGSWRRGGFDRPALLDAVDGFLGHGGLRELARMIEVLTPLLRADRAADLLNTPRAWQLVCALYQRAMPHESFLHYFWAWRALFGGLLATLAFPLPPARVYHSVSTGYAGLLCARATIESGRPALVTEHGIYTNERRIEILQADWIVDMIDRGFLIDDPRRDLRDFWASAFESYARACYDACGEIITLHEANQAAQRILGAGAGKLRIIPNGVDWQTLSRLPQASDDLPPTVALIGRVVPIKDVTTYLQAVKMLHVEFPTLRALVLGPTDEQPDYYEACLTTTAKLGLSQVVQFAGRVDVADYLPRVHVNVLTSLSESQPLTVLEAGAAGVPTVTTDVGSCREILFGRRDEHPVLGSGGMLTDVASPRQTADAMATLLRDPARRRRYGEVMRERVGRYYNLAGVDEAYTALYRHYVDLPTRHQRQR